ncbi:uncharacterized protein LOC108668575 [Hyalella azteca]|uniref:Uncharacterized protein LOC108668575 n=1 Tax=Hyalella azteca TaxID=294128 RepID=A0A8B7NCN2_HYAAZ|nr:uncharacterized protein LOC108668575 [Hyalella azteca]
MKDAFLVNGRNCWVSLEKTGLAWYLNDSEKVVYRVPACEIVSCWSCPRGLMRCCPTRGAKNDLISTPQKQSTSSNTESTGLTHAASDQTLQTVVLEEENPGASGNLDLPQHSNAPQMSQLNNTSNHSPCNAVEERNNVEFWPQPKQCRHSNRPGLSLEICERVLPSSCSSCVVGETNETMVTKWRPRVLVLHHDSHDTVCSWHEAIWKLVASESDRVT